MTESIFVPFRLTTKESIEKAVKVLTSEPTPWPKSEQNYTVEYFGTQRKSRKQFNSSSGNSPCTVFFLQFPNAFQLKINCLFSL